MLFDDRQSKFETMVRALSGDLYRFAYWRCRDRGLAEDLVQETFARAWAGWQNLRDDKTAKSWLFTILRHEHARMFEHKQPERDEEQQLDELIAEEITMQERMEIRQALYALPLGYREPLLMQVLGGFSCAEIAAAMSLNEGAVMTRLTRARQALRKLLSAEIHLKERKSGMS